MTSDLVAKALKGPKGTHVEVTTIRDGQAKPLVFDLIRDEIPHPSVDLKYEIRPGVGYIHLSQFQETTAQEVIDAINSFGNLKGLVLDLRGNPGGTAEPGSGHLRPPAGQGAEHCFAARAGLSRPGVHG